MTTYIKEERFDDFKAHAFEYGFHKFKNEWCDTHSKVPLFVKENGEMTALVDDKVITDIPYEYIQRLVWDGYIKKVQ